MPMEIVASGSETWSEKHTGQNLKTLIGTKMLDYPEPTLPHPYPPISQSTYKCMSAWWTLLPVVKSRVLVFFPFHRWETDLEWFRKFAMVDHDQLGFPCPYPQAPSSLIFPSLLQAVFSLLRMHSMSFQVLGQIPCTLCYCCSLTMCISDFTHT